GIRDWSVTGVQTCALPICEGHVFAYSVDADSIYAVPTEIADPVKAASSLCGALGDCTFADRQALAERIRRGRAFVYVRRQVTPEIGRASCRERVQHRVVAV